MSLSTIDPRTALIVVDLQKGITALPGAGDVVANAASLAAAFRERGLPVVLVTVSGRAPGRTEQARTAPVGERPDGWDQLADELDAQHTDHLVTKNTWGAFTGTDLNEHLAAAGVTQVVIVGIATSIGVESTARQAHEHGYHVTLATDAMIDLDPAAHENSLARIFPRLGETGTTAEVLALLG